jgi:polar amino acid transport system permease protein
VPSPDVPGSPVTAAGPAAGVATAEPPAAGAGVAGGPAHGAVGAPPEGGSEHEAIKAVPVRHPGRWVASAVVLLLVAMLAHGLVTNDRFRWDVVRRNLFAEPVLRGLWATVYLTFFAMLIGIVGGVLLAVMRLSPNPLLRGASWTYTWFFRGTPQMVQLIFWATLGALYPRISIGVPFGPEFASGDANELVPLLMAAILGLGLNEAAYMAEIVRAGITSVDEGQTEAAHALGMSRSLTMRRIVLPQAMKVIIPPTGNETISMLKTTSLVSVIAVTELLYAVQLIYARNYQTIPLLMVAAIWYLALTSVLSVGQHFLERRYDPALRGMGRAGALGWPRNRGGGLG